MRRPVELSLKDAPQFSFFQHMSFARIGVFCLCQQKAGWVGRRLRDLFQRLSCCRLWALTACLVFIQFRDTLFSFVAHLCREHSGKYLLTWHFGLFSAQVKPPTGKNRVQCLLFGCQRAPCHFLPEHMVLLLHSHRGRWSVKGGCWLCGTPLLLPLF